MKKFGECWPILCRSADTITGGGIGTSLQLQLDIERVVRDLNNIIVAFDIIFAISGAAIGVSRYVRDRMTRDRGRACETGKGA